MIGRGRGKPLSCAFGDCGRRDCQVCALARTSVPVSAATIEPTRDDAQAVPKPPRERPIWMPKKRHRRGPHH